MIVRLSDYIVSPLAMGTHANYECVKAGQSKLREYAGKWGLPEPFMASVMEEEALSEACREEGISTSRHTRFEQMAILAAARALRETDVSPDAENVLFVIATTKGNIELSDDHPAHLPKRSWLTEAARQITAWFHNPNMPLVVCNACISGLSAQIEAIRLISSQRYRYAVVIGADVLSRFIVSGFQSLKALSREACRPFDEDRNGLNLGEAAACIVYGDATTEQAKAGGLKWFAVNGAIRNDAFHLSGVSKKAEGAFRALKTVCEGEDLSQLAFINAHGTATMFNDEMESVAIGRMGLDARPVFGLKGYYGHTMGASGVLETLIAMEALDDNCTPATKGYEHSGVSHAINISKTPQEVCGTDFLKMMSGFGGCNAALWFKKGKLAPHTAHPLPDETVTVTHQVHLTERQVLVDGRPIQAEGCGMQLLKSLYQTHIEDYPKYHKMDALCKLAFIASELLLQAEASSEQVARFIPCEDRAVVLVGRSASLCADETFRQSIQHAEAFYPSPSAFIYTLPNIATGEIAIRNQYHGETSYFVQDAPENVGQLMHQALYAKGTRSVIGGWIDMEDAAHFEATLYIIKR